MALTSSEKLSKINLGLHTYSLELPRYFALFFNLNPAEEDSDILNDIDLRKALSYATDKDEIVKNVLSGYGRTVDSPVMPEIYNIQDPENTYSFDLEKAKSILEENGFQIGEDNYRVQALSNSQKFCLSDRKGMKSPNFKNV